MTENKRFTNIEHDYENAWIRCNDDGYFMIYAIYKELDEGLPSLEDLLNGLSEENEQLKTQLQNTCDQRDEFHRGARENANRVGQLEKENKELKQKIKETIFDVDVLIDISPPNTERLNALMNLKENMIESFGEWVIFE